MPQPEIAVRDKYAELARSYDREVALFERLVLARLRRRLAQYARGRVLEIGAGTGANLSYYPNEVRVTAVDLSAEMLGHARGSQAAASRAFDFGLMEAQGLAIKDAAFDTVVCTLALCTIPDPAMAVREMQRVCRPDGRLLFLEHVPSTVRMVSWLQDRLAGWHFRRTCCRWNQDTPRAIALAGLTPLLLEERFLGVLLLKQSPFESGEPPQAGTALPPSLSFSCLASLHQQVSRGLAALVRVT